MSKTTPLHVHHAFFYICLPPPVQLRHGTTKLLSCLADENGKVINYYLSLNSDAVPSLQFQPNWVTCYQGGKNFEGRKVYFSSTFSLASRLSERKVPSAFTQHDGRKKRTAKRL